ncbi:MAG: Gfo/Idh/MocA family oxidoreductase [Treponema sp.]|jgi:predicted dehydrogenase|nr:Gfo/Idh/MocA family oxidoreductase [Treponema sp.]
MKIGTVGTNFIVDTFIEAVRKTGKAEIAACYSRQPETAAGFAKKNGVPKSYTERDAFLQDRDLDCIYVAAPNALHYAWARDALTAGRSVICEKPFVSNAAELEDLAALAKEKGLFLFEALTVPHLPNFRLIREKLSALGPVRFVQLNFSQYSSRYDAFLAGKNPNLFSPDFSGGALMDLNYYNLCFMLRLFGEPGELRYFVNKAENGIDISGLLVLRYGGFIASAAATKDSDGSNFVQIQGEKGYIVSRSTASNLRGGFELVTRVAGAPSKEEHFNAQESGNVLVYEVEDFVREYAAGDPSASWDALAESVTAARWMDRARKDAGIVFTADRRT